MKAKIEREIADVPGKIGVYYKNLDTGTSWGINEQESFIAASVIKLPILAVVFQEIHRGKIRRDDVLKLTTADKVPSCGALNLMHSGLDVTIKDLCNLMITISDNTATNMLIKTLGIEKLNAGFAELGLKHTQLNRLLFDQVEKKKGKENHFAPVEIGMLLERIYQRTLISEDLSREMEEILRLQQINSKMPHLLPSNIVVAHKTGEDNGITHDVGIVFGDNPYILCFASNNTDVVLAEAAIRKIALLCYKHIPRH